jgi:hypothetical protein
VSACRWRRPLPAERRRGRQVRLPDRRNPGECRQTAGPRDPRAASPLGRSWRAGSACRQSCFPDGSSAVVRGVVETPWTSSATPDAARHRDASSSAHAGLHGRGKSAWTGTGLLITERSRVQIPPPLPSLQVRGLFRSRKGPSACAVCTELVHEASEEGRRGGRAVRRTPGDVVRDAGGEWASTEVQHRMSAINCRKSATYLLLTHERADPGFRSPAGRSPGAG